MLLLDLDQKVERQQEESLSQPWNIYLRQEEKFYKIHVKKFLTQQKMWVYIHQKMRINIFIASLFQIAQERKYPKSRMSK